jgi:hypothetical protein
MTQTSPSPPGRHPGGTRVAPAAGCRTCGCPKTVHEHLREGSDCGSCGSIRCSRYRRPRLAGRLGRGVARWTR